MRLSNIKKEIRELQKVSGITHSPSGGSEVPKYAIVAFATPSCPDGWQISDGTNNSPDLRGMFIRGAGTNSTSSTMTATGSQYAATYSTTTVNPDSMQGHHHSLTGYSDSGSLSATNTPGTASGGTSSTINIVDEITDGTNGVPRVGAETIPANIALTYCMKL